MSDPVLRLNPALDVRPFARTYARDGLVQVPNVFEPEVAERLTKVLETSIPWSRTYFGPDNRPVKVPIEDIRGPRAQTLQTELQEMMQRAGKQYGFLYYSFGMISAYVAGELPDHPIHQLTEFVNSPEMLDFGRALTGQKTIRKADAQATLYRPLDFIGLHADQNHEGVERVAAYTLGFTRRWRSDWGGQLMFHDDKNGDVTRGLAPRWNTLTLFKVPRLHSVAPVAPYAQAPRLSVIGWFRTDP